MFLSGWYIYEMFEVQSLLFFSIICFLKRVRDVSMERWFHPTFVALGKLQKHSSKVAKPQRSKTTKKQSHKEAKSQRSKATKKHSA